MAVFWKKFCVFFSLSLRPFHVSSRFPTLLLLLFKCSLCFSSLAPLGRERRAKSVGKLGGQQLLAFPFFFLGKEEKRSSRTRGEGHRVLHSSSSSSTSRGSVISEHH
uniref:Putative secreted protein n=1 Tax=Anopheles darlingi TaxID=43151 RepID=A0A2M4DH24_ANODA